MGLLVLAVLSAALVAVSLGGVVNNKHEVTEEPLLMPKVHPTKDDTYLCTVLKIEKDSVNIVKFKPQAKKEVAHHILIYGCSEPGTRDNVWNCGEMSASEADTREYNFGGVCKAGSKIIYAWAMDAPSLTLPKGVGFEVGQATDASYLVMQVHYKDTSKFKADKNVKDQSGVILETTTKPMPHPAGIYLLGTAGELPPHRTVFMETACAFKYPQRIFPFAFRTHTHKHGQFVVGYRIRDGKWAQIGGMNPQEPQMFYNVTNPALKDGVKNGDILAARCIMENNDDHAVFVGATQKDEMCNFYVMYFMRHGKPVKNYSCFRSGPPAWYWQDSDHASEMNLSNEPVEARMVPGSSQRLNDNTRLSDFTEFSFL